MAATTDLGNAGRLVKVAGHLFRYVPPWGRFVVWDGHRWQEDSKEVMMGALATGVIQAVWKEYKAEVKPGRKSSLRSWWHESQSAPRMSAMIRVVRSDKTIHAIPSEFNTAAWLLPVQNGTVDLQTGKLLLANPDHKFTRVCPVRFDVSKKCPAWLRFLDQVFPDEEIRGFIQQYIGYCLTGDVSARLMVICLGTGRNGKSVLLRVVGDLLGIGEFAVAANSELLLTTQSSQHPTEMAALFGARLALLSEVRKGRTWDEEKLKRLTGNDVVAARRMHEDWWNYPPTAKLITAMNDKPHVADHTHSFWDRIALVPFTVRIEDSREDKHILTKLRAELSGILNWALEGCVAYQRAGGFTLPAACKEARDSYRRDEDQLGECLNDVLTLHPLGRVTNEEVAQLVGEWCRKTGKAIVWSKRTIGMRLKELGLTEVRSGTGRGWQGAMSATKQLAAMTVKKVAP